jgi:hypothetical protein
MRSIISTTHGRDLGHGPRTASGSRHRPAFFTGRRIARAPARFVLLRSDLKLQPLSGSGSYGSYSSSSQLSAQAAIVLHEYDQYVGELKTLELKSQATPAEFLALRDDVRAISVAASAAKLPASAAKGTAADVSLQLDRSPLYGSATAAGWGVVSARVTTNLDSLGVTQPLIDQTIADMKALANSANVSTAEFQAFT